jgi:hypothetical protein
MLAAVAVFAQSESAYDVGGWRGGGTSPTAGSETGETTSLLDPSRLTINHSMSFYAGGSQVSDVKSQSMYSTMFQYKFNAPVVLSLNFDMPIHSTFNQHSNFTSDNLSSLDYFRNIPIDAAVTWMPTDKFMLGVRIMKMPESGGFYSGFHRSDRFHRGW